MSSYILSLYKGFLSNTYLQVKSIFNQNANVKKFASDLKKKKATKGSSKQEKIEFFQAIANEFIVFFKQQKVLSDLIQAHDLLSLEVKEVKSWNKYEQWIGWALDFGEDSYLATHIAKLTHSSSKGASCDVRYHNSCDKYNSQYLSTSDKPILDAAYPDNKYSSISQFYSIEVGERYIGDLLREGNEHYLRCFTKKSKLLKFWCQSFSRLIKNEKKNSYFLSKQTYFPIEGKQYHLLLPLTSSSLVHELHLEHKKYFEEEEKISRAQKKNKKYSVVNTCSYPNKAYIHVTGSNHSNASSLNGKRGGRIALLSAMPPKWQSNYPSYINKTEIFDRGLEFALKAEINELKKYLLLVKSKSLSISDSKRNATVIRKLRAISGNFFNYIEEVNIQTAIENWTVESHLPIEQQLLFEYNREDEIAMSIKTNKKWMKTLSKSYGRWLNNQLKSKSKLSLTPIHERIWTDAFLIELREFIAIQEVTL